MAVISVPSRRENDAKSRKIACDGIVAVLSVPSRREKEAKSRKTACDGIVAVLSVPSRREKGCGESSDWHYYEYQRVPERVADYKRGQGLGAQEVDETPDEARHQGGHNQHKVE